MTFPFKLGKLPAKHDLRIPMLSRYTLDLPAPKDACNWADNMSNFGIMANDRLGDCTAAGLAHQLQIWTYNCGNEVTLTDEQVIAFYSATSGYNPADPNTDQGGVESDILKQWLATPNLLGLTKGVDAVSGYSLAGFAAFRPQVQSSMKDSIWFLGGAYLGLALPETIENQGLIWSVPAQGPTGNGAPGSLGGHAVCACGYDSRYVYFISWGSLYQMTWDFVTTYCEEAYALVSTNWINSKSLSPSGFDLTTLKQDMTALAALTS